MRGSGDLQIPKHRDRANEVDRIILPFCTKSPFQLLALAHQDFLLGLLIVANEGEPEVSADGDRMAVMFCARAPVRPERTGTTFQFLRRQYADSGAQTKIGLGFKLHRYLVSKLFDIQNCRA
jgi:hypothetical protein